MAYDPVDHVFAGVNNADDPPFITLISTGPDRKILAKIEYKDATDGAEQPFYLASAGMIYDSIPQVGPDKAKGAVAEIDPRQGTLVRMLPVENCHPAGLVGGPGDNLLLGWRQGERAAAADGGDRRPQRGGGEGDPGHRRQRHGGVRPRAGPLLHGVAQHAGRPEAGRDRRQGERAGAGGRSAGR